MGKFPAFPDGSRLSVLWDLATCSPIADHHIVFGYGSGLPATAGASFAVNGSRCDIGSTPPQPFPWAGIPDPGAADPTTRLLWFLVLTNDDGTTEGSWGHDSSGVERNGATASGECGVATKNLGNLCGT